MVYFTKLCQLDLRANGVRAGAENSALMTRTSYIVLLLSTSVVNTPRKRLVDGSRKPIWNVTGTGTSGCEGDVREASQSSHSSSSLVISMYTTGLFPAVAGMPRVALRVEGRGGTTLRRIRFLGVATCRLVEAWSSGTTGWLLLAVWPSEMTGGSTAMRTVGTG